jgi:hypothetical protein
LQIILSPEYLTHVNSFYALFRLPSALCGALCHPRLKSCNDDDRRRQARAVAPEKAAHAIVEVRQTKALWQTGHAMQRQGLSVLVLPYKVPLVDSRQNVRREAYRRFIRKSGLQKSRPLRYLLLVDQLATVESDDAERRLQMNKPCSSC